MFSPWELCLSSHGGHSLTRTWQNDGSGVSKRRDIPSLAVEIHGRDVVPRRSDSELPRYGAARKWSVTTRYL